MKGYDYMAQKQIPDENIITKNEKLNAPAVADEELLYDIAELFKVFGDSTRIRILYSLFEKEMCVFEIAEILSMSQSAISHQLRVLKQARLVKYRRDGKTIYYSLCDDHIQIILNMGLEHVSE
jgi:ArsR family transcriptional regulator